MKKGKPVLVKKDIKSKVGKISSAAIDKIVYFQQELKELSAENYEKLKKSILEHGIISPGFVWKDKGKLYALDCHQRLKTLKQMRTEGVQVPDKIPVVEIFAESKKEAKRFLLQYVSQHGKVTEDGLYDFLHDAELDGDIGELELELNLDGIDFGEFSGAFFGSEDGGDQQEDGVGGKIEEVDEKFTFVVSKEDAARAHKALKKAEREIEDGGGGKIFMEICNSYLRSSSRKR